MDMENAPMAQSTAFNIQAEGMRGPGRPKMAGMYAADREGLQRVEALGYRPS